VTVILSMKKIATEQRDGSFRPQAHVRVGFRKPLKGEHYLSGAVVTAYLAPNDLPTEYMVVRPTGKVDERLWGLR
jgi:hypothetical protein